MKYREVGAITLCHREVLEAVECGTTGEIQINSLRYVALVMIDEVLEVEDGAVVGYLCLCEGRGREELCGPGRTTRELEGDRDGGGKACKIINRRGHLE